MTVADVMAHPVALWLIIAVVLGIAELLVPEIFLVFLAAAAAMTAALALVFPDMPLAAQMISFGAWSVVAVLTGRQLYGRIVVPTTDPLLNDRSARIVGQTVRVTDAIEDGRGRVRVGDGEWPASGADAMAGSNVKVVAVINGVVRVVPLDGNSAG